MSFEFELNQLKTHIIFSSRREMPAGTITALRAQVNDAQRVNVFVDGEFALGVSLSTITKAGLFVGKPLSAEEFTRLEQLESSDKAFGTALRFLEARPRSVAEVRDRLARTSIPSIDAAVARCVSRNAGRCDCLVA